MRQARFTPDARAKFLAALRECGIVRDACESAGITRPTAYNWRAKDLGFAEEWERAEDEATERLEREAVRRAVYGVRKPVYQGGKRVGTIREYSDRLLEFLLAARSDRFRTRRVEVTGAAGGPIETHSVTDAERAARIAELLIAGATKGARRAVGAGEAEDMDAESGSTD